MNLDRLASVALQKAQAAINRPLTTLQLRSTVTSASYRERCILLDMAWLFTGDMRVVYDVGASSGLYTSAFTKALGVHQVVAFEPLGDMFERLKVRFDGSEKVRTINVALSDSEGTTTFHRSEFSPSSSLLEMAALHKTLFPASAGSEDIEVKVSRLDDVVKRYQLPWPDVIKIDVQGVEDRVIRGGPNSFRAASFCIVEVQLQPLYEGAATFETVAQALGDQGYIVAGFIDQLKVERSSAPVAADVVFRNLHVE